MAARSVFKLLTKTCSYSLNPTCTSSATPLEDTQRIRSERTPRSYSQPPRKNLHNSEPFIPNRKISKSLENIRGKFTKKISKYFDKDVEDLRDEEYQVEQEEEDIPTRIFSEYRESAREFKEKYVEPEPERNEEGGPIYELADGPKRDFYDIRQDLLKKDKERPTKVFPHLQPSQLKPFGSNENLYFPDLFKRRPKIVYPVVNTTGHQESSRRKRVDDVQRNEFSSFRKQAEASEELIKKKPSYEKLHKFQKDVSKMSYSTCQIAKKSQPIRPPKLAIRKSNCNIRKSSTTLVSKKKFQMDNVLDANRVGIMEQFYKRANEFKEFKAMRKQSREKFLKCDSRQGSTKNLLLDKSKKQERRRFNTFSSTRPSQDRNNTRESFLNKSKQDGASRSLNKSKLEETSRSLNTLNKQLEPSTTREVATKQKLRADSYASYSNPAAAPNVDCDEFVTVKLSELKEECIREKKCKPKKICFGRLPKFTPMDCPCIEDINLKEGAPLLRLKKRFDVLPKPRICPDLDICTTPRADDNYQIKKKTLPKLELKECPCIEKEYLDFTIKRLPKKKVPEPPRVCPPCVIEKCCPPRADDNLKICPKNLPKLKANNCPCIEPPPPEEVRLMRLKPKPVKEPEKICIEETCADTPRADEGYQVKKKTLPILKPDCICVEPPPMLEVPPLARLKKIDIKEKPRVSCEPPTCDEIPRADDKLKVKKKKLCPFVPKVCPCIEEEPPSVNVKLKRLIPRPVVEKEEVCIVEECGARADDNYVIKKKKLPEIVPQDCPCVEIEMQDVPLKRLVPKPVKEPERICVLEDVCDCIERADKCMKPKKKCLPKLPPGNCPCIEEEPPHILPKLAKLKKRPVTYERICPEEEECPPRADENLKVKIKKLPKLEIPDCPCIDPPSPEDVRPLQRLKKKPVKEPPRICPVVDDCEEAKRADEHDWLYWKRVEVKKGDGEGAEGETDPCKTTKRSYSTRARFNPPITKRSYSTKTRSNSANIAQKRHFCSTSTNPANDLFEMNYDIPKWESKHLQEASQSVVIDIKPSAPLILTQTPVKRSEEEAFSLKLSKSEPLDAVAFMIYKNNSFSHTPSKDSFNHFFNRFISTCSALYEYSEKNNEVSKECECPPNDRHLQPRNPIIPEKETFIQPFPDDNLIDDSIRKSRMYYRTRKDSKQEEADVECQEDQKALCEVEEEMPICPPEKKPSLWERIVSYFKARPDCPSPEEFKKMRLREDAEKAAEKAGLCLYDPKEMLRKNEKEMPKVMTASNINKDEECSK